MITVKVNGLTETLRRIDEYRNNVQRKANELARRLADMGATNVSLMFARAIYDGTPDNNIEVEQEEENKFVIKASGTTVMFVEFGTGVYYADDHPLAAEFGLIRGSFGKGHGKQETWAYYGEPGSNGWTTSKRPGLVFTHGNPANMPMYNTAADLRNEIERVAREVFQS